MSDDTFPTGTLMAGKRGLIMGVANKNSIAWAIAQQLAAQGAELAFTFQGEKLERRVKPLAASVGSEFLLDCDVTNDDQMDATFAALEAKWGKIDFLVHAIAFAGKDQLAGSFIEQTTREGFKSALDISAYSFVDAGRRAARIMNDDGAMVTLTYLGSERVIPNYNVMGVAKAALEASTRYMAADLGPRGIRVNAISAGPIKTLAAAGIGSGRHMFRFNKAASAMQDHTESKGVAGAALYLLSSLGASCTGETHHVDGGFHAIGMPQEAPLRASLEE
ncbi:enoyl-[acyl-carrier-protein] reductase [NADH] [Algimonas ampicilliniresistens]|uniref:Enoyl-[acyl-carrier-protein] reductase [NADH] n=1 Tax=Algimonas ampicilliniresistens TaxID=1298735 RepID=A0ABQ5V4X4_9PROT|nr:enoyl-ACP reductase [Algimonas ampicilliniresistens]GLQ22593.1 enoyl-[acyl-carrier-protein] reductase [NADH] [Algimonas ampicilliniresistens]